MGLLQTIQTEAASATTPLCDVLRKTLILASRLDSAELGAWVNNELNGYPPDAALPPYRTLRNLGSKGHLFGPAGSELRNVPLAVDLVDASIAKVMETMNLRDCVAAYEDLVSQNTGTLTAEWPASTVAILSRKFVQFYSLARAWREVPRSAIVGLLDSVRNKVLAFTLELERLDPTAGEVADSSGPVPAPAIHQMVTNVFYGDVGNVATGSSDFVQEQA